MCTTDCHKLWLRIRFTTMERCGQFTISFSATSFTSFLPYPRHPPWIYPSSRPPSVVPSPPLSITYGVGLHVVVCPSLSNSNSTGQCVALSFGRRQIRQYLPVRGGGCSHWLSSLPSLPSYPLSLYPSRAAPSGSSSVGLLEIYNSQLPIETMICRGCHHFYI